MGCKGHQNHRGAKWVGRGAKSTEELGGWKGHRKHRGAKWDGRVTKITEQLSGMEVLPKTQRR